MKGKENKVNHDELMGKVLELPIVEILANKILEKEFLEYAEVFTINQRLEYPLMTGTYTNGFIDILIDIAWDKDWEERSVFVIELKLTEQDLGHTIRQLNLYEKLLKQKENIWQDIYKVAIFLEEITNTTRNVLKNAGVYGFTLDELKKTEIIHHLKQKQKKKGWFS